jgi:hypothetical protein
MMARAAIYRSALDLRAIPFSSHAVSDELRFTGIRAPASRSPARPARRDDRAPVSSLRIVAELCSCVLQLRDPDTPAA